MVVFMEGSNGKDEAGKQISAGDGDGSFHK
jgi:hypothetical protein